MRYKICFVSIAVLAMLTVLTLREKPQVPDPRIIPVTTAIPETGRVFPIAIIGAGAAGTMAVQRAVLNNNETLIFTGDKKELKRSRGTWVRKVDNVPGLQRYERAVLDLRNETIQELYLSDFRDKLFVVEDSISSIVKEGDLFTLRDKSGREYYAEYVVMATGMMDEQPHIQGSIRPVLSFANGQTIAYCLLCDGHRSLGKKAVVIGHSESAGLNALTVSEKYQPAQVAILTNGKKHAFSPQLLERIRKQNIQLIEDPIRQILGAEKQLAGFELETGMTVEAEIAFVSLGIRPNNQLALQLGAKVDANGLVCTDKVGESSVPNLFVVGDLRADSLKQIYTAWQHSVESLQVINRRIRERIRERVRERIREADQPCRDNSKN